TRVYARRSLDFDLDLADDQPRTFAALWRTCHASALGARAADPRSVDALAVDEAFEQALTIVYRLLFLLFAEARALVPLWHPIYRESYSIESVRDDAERSPRAAGLWDALRAVARLAHTGCRAGELRVT